MHRILLFLWLGLVAGLSQTAVGAPAEELPPRPAPFRFVNDQAQLLPAANAKTLENGLRRYADENGTQIVVVTVPSLGGRNVAEYARELGTAWGIGQRDKNNGVVVLIGAQERNVTIQAGSGLRQQITPALTSQIINEKMTPSFKQGRYFAGLRSGLNALMLAANPGSAPASSPAAATSPATSAAAGVGANGAGSGAELASEFPAQSAVPEPVAPTLPAAEPASSGFGWGTLALGALVIGGGIWLVSKLFRRRAPAAPGPSPTPDFLPNQSTQPGQPNDATRGYGQRPVNQPGNVPDFLPNRTSGFGGGSGGSGVGGMLMTGAAAAAGAYLGNRMAQGHDNPDSSAFHPDGSRTFDPDAAGAAGGAAAAGAVGGAASTGGFPALGGTDATPEAEPDYFSEDYTANDSPDYFSSSDDSSSYDDTSSDDTGGGGFDSDDNTSGSW
ncbi:TPM domain-containing protein [Hymenobacter sublimis]|uniref:TPM domain-containing protein n=1 Tax=Hymenobacter sublimis TaxID=2933777 RepID=A0ABY4J7Z5_9BACT|nr:TPM domain-containing protein [Hymenobacter sublimis]UPL48938.1 TPM domain-containing protein [Hymenobacter sublimis]